MRWRSGGRATEEGEDKREEKQEKEQEQKFGPIFLGQCCALASGSVETLCLTIDDYEGVYGTLEVKVYNRDLMPD